MRRALILLALGLGLEGKASARPTDVAGADLYRYAAGDTVEQHDTARFRIFYTRSGVNAVPAADANTNGVPDHVEEVGQLYEDVLTFYLARGFRQPLSDAARSNNGGDGRFDVYLLDFAGKADGAFTRDGCSGGTCAGYMVQENDFAGYAYPSATIGNRILCSHEFFHAVQAAYSVDQDSVVSEGTAVWATEQFDPSLGDLEGFIGGYLSMSDRSLDRPGTGPVPAFAYGAAIFFQFLSEEIAPDVVRTLWEDLAPGARGIDQQTWLPALVALLPRDHGTSFADAFTTFATWNLFTLNRSDPTRAYANGDNYPAVKITNGQLPLEDTALRVFYASSQVLGFSPAGRGQITVQVLPAAGLGEESLASLRVVVAPVTSGKVGTPTTLPASMTNPPVEVAGATQVLVVLVNTATAGESTRGTLCVGDANEAAACVQKNAPAGMVTPNPIDDEGGCQLGGRGRPAGLLLVALSLLGLRARRALVAVLLLGACHPAPPARPPASTSVVEGKLRLAEGSARGKLVLGWLDQEEAERWRRGDVRADDFVHLLSRLQIEDDVTLTPAARPFRVAAPEGARALAVLDTGAQLWPALLGAGGWFGMSEDGELILRARPERKPRACDGERTRSIVIDAPEVSGTLGNPRLRRFCALLPASYEQEPLRRYPVVYLLPGFHSDDVAYFHGRSAVRPLVDRVSRELGREVIVVGVDTSTRVGSTYLVDSPVNGAFDRFLAGRALDEIDRQLRTLATREGRALVGHSTGGFNVVSFGLRHPERFSVVGASSPDALDLDVWLLGRDGRVSGWLLDWIRVEGRVGGLGQMLSYAADWSPGLDGGWELPCDPRSGKPTPAYASWKAHSPAVLVETPPIAAELKDRWTDRIYLSVGEADEFGLTPPTEAFARRLEGKGVRPRFEKLGRGHFDGQMQRMEQALRFVTQRLAAAR